MMQVCKIKLTTFRPQTAGGSRRSQECEHILCALAVSYTPTP